ncbi:MAG: TonB-dependent receptor, partial [Bacteroidetes bacterium]|nr:TonB-dependent receptor [Bacteroidota bacterium]
EGYTGGIPVEYQNPEKYGEGTNWYRTLTRNGAVQNYSLSFSAGSEKASVSVIGGYFSQEGIVKNTGYKRYSLRINSDFNISKNIKFGANLAPSLQTEHNNRQGGNFNIDGQRAILASALMIPSMGSPYNVDGSLALGIQGFPSLFSWANPLRQLMEIKDDATRPRLLSNVFTEIKFLQDFTFRSSFNVDLAGFLRKKFVPSTARGGFNVVPIDNAPPGSKSAYGESNTNSSITWTNENTVSYQKTFAKDHFVQALAGFTSQRFVDYRNNLTGEDFPDNEIQYLNAAARASAFNSTSTSWSMLSMLARVNYEYKGRYLLQGAIRRDGSSRFGIDNRWGYFPSVGAGWIVSDENFMRNARAINFLKLRASYGTTGNNEIGDYTSIALIAPSNYVFGNTLASGKAQSTLANSKLSWEKNNQFDAGIDIGLLNDRVTVTYDYYNKKTVGLLYPVAVPLSSGFGSVQDNVGDIKFWGHEITVNGKVLTGPLRWNSTFNISFN